MRPIVQLRNERGMAVLIVLLVTLAVASIMLGAAMMTLNAGLIQRSSERSAVLEDVALAGLEEGRSRLNGVRGLYPDSGYVRLDSLTIARDASGAALPRLTRTIWAGPTGVVSGQYGVYGSLVAEARDSFGNRLIRRLDVNQESFAKFAYFTDVEPSNISFGATDQIDGPVHTNDVLKIYPPSGGSKARFRDEVTTAQTVQVPANGTFDRGYSENAPRIEMPTVAELTKLRAQAQAGGMYFAGSAAGNAGQATVRIEFVAVDLNGDGDVTDEDEGFVRIFRGVDPAFVVASVPATGAGDSRNCGDTQGNHIGLFRSVAAHPAAGAPHNKAAALNDASAFCYLGGDPILTNGWVAANADGTWLTWPGLVDPRLLGRPDRAQLWPLGHTLNPNFKGVIYVEGKVAVSGTLRGRVTVVSPLSIIIPDDVRQATDPAALPRNCADILGILSAGDVVVSDNSINAPVNTAGAAYKTMDTDGRDEFIQAVVLTLTSFTVEDFTVGPTNKEKCETTNWGRGCLYLTGGIIQRTRGAVGTTGGTGNLKRYAYNACAYTNPPPYFPTTGHFAKNRVSQIDPVGFDVDAWFAANAR
ncbi:MAG: hypothetical protein ACREOQ_16500 [Gemmatimonadales bacterium]